MGGNGEEVWNSRIHSSVLLPLSLFWLSAVDQSLRRVAGWSGKHIHTHMHLCTHTCTHSQGSVGAKFALYSDIVETLHTGKMCWITRQKAAQAGGTGCDSRAVVSIVEEDKSGLSFCSHSFSLSLWSRSSRGCDNSWHLPVFSCVFTTYGIFTSGIRISYSLSCLLTSCDLCFLSQPPVTPLCLYLHSLHHNFLPLFEDLWGLSKGETSWGPLPQSRMIPKLHYQRPHFKPQNLCSA